MTDVNISPTDNTNPSAPVSADPNSAAVSHVPGGNDADPIEDGDGFSANLDAFLGHSLQDEYEAANPEPAVQPSPAPQGGAGAEPVSAAPAPASPAPAAAPQPVAAPSVPNDAPASGTVPPAAPSPVSEAELAQMLLGTPAAAPAPAQPSSGVQPQAAQPTAQVFRPFPADFRFPSEITNAIFNNDDVESRDRAFSGFIVELANTVAMQTERHVRETLGPQFRNDLYADMTANSQRSAAMQQIISTAPELADPTYMPLIVQALNVVGRQVPPETPVTPEFLAKVGALAREAKARLIQPAAQPQTQQQVQAAAPAASAVFLTNGARPAGAGELEDRNSPAGMLEDLTAWHGG